MYDDGKAKRSLRCNVWTSEDDGEKELAWLANAEQKQCEALRRITLQCH